jgi:hypothetical protein
MRWERGLYRDSGRNTFHYAAVNNGFAPDSHVSVWNVEQNCCVLTDAFKAETVQARLSQ